MKTSQRPIPAQSLARRQSNPTMDDIATGIRVRHIQTPIEQVTSVRGNQPAAAARQVLATAGYSAAPVVDHEGAVVGILARDDIPRDTDAPVAVFQRPVTPDVLVSADAAIQQLLAWFALAVVDGPPWYFVFDGKSITGIVTPWDIGRQAGRTYLYLRLATVEMGLADVLRRIVRDQERLVRLSSPTRRAAIVSRYEVLRDLDENADLIAAFDFQDTFEIAGRIPSLAARLQPAVGMTLGKFGYKVTDIRNAVMHASRLDIAPNRDPTLALAELDGRLGRLGQAIERLPRRLPLGNGQRRIARSARPSVDDLVGLTPERLARELGCRASSLRHFLRMHHPRPTTRSGVRWGPLNRAIVMSVLTRFGPGSQWCLANGVELRG
jgi:CBS domain-containing protein